MTALIALAAIAVLVVLLFPAMRRTYATAGRRRRAIERATARIDESISRLELLARGGETMDEVANTRVGQAVRPAGLALDYRTQAALPVHLPARYYAVPEQWDAQMRVLDREFKSRIMELHAAAVRTSMGTIMSDADRRLHISYSRLRHDSAERSAYARSGLARKVVLKRVHVAHGGMREYAKATGKGRQASRLYLTA